MPEQPIALVGVRHPEYNAMYSEWVKWRHCYQGGLEFRDNYLERYSKRETWDDFALRKKITYIPAHARSAINIVRNALAVRIPEVTRNGSDMYNSMMATNVDGQNRSINSFVVLEIIPLLLTQGKRFVVVDAPALGVPGVTRAEDDGAPYLYALNAENMLSWAYDIDGNFTAVLMELQRELIDAASGLAYGVEQMFRYMRIVPEGPVDDPDGLSLNGPGVFVKTMDKGGKLLEEARVLPIDRIPIVEFRLVASLMGEIAEHQIALLNLASTDMDFLWRGNFPIYTEQVPKATAGIRPRGTKASQEGAGATEDSVQNRESGTDPNSRQRRVGIAKGLIYRDGTERPDFIAPGVDNLKASMEKQEALVKDIRVLVDLALVSLSAKAVEQSGASKMADRVGEEAGLAYIGRALEAGEREMAELWHMMNGESEKRVVITYPANYTLKTQEERIEEAEKMSALRSKVRSPEYRKIVDARVAEILLKPVTTPEELEMVQTEIRTSEFIDDDKERADIIGRDNALGLVSNETASRMRGYADGESEKALAEKQAAADTMSGARGEGSA